MPASKSALCSCFSSCLISSRLPRPKTATSQIEDTGTYFPYSFRTMPRVLFKNYVWGWRRQGQQLNVLGQWHNSLHLERIFHRYLPWCQRLFWPRPTAEDVLAFGPHRKFPPRARKTSGTQGNRYHELRNQVFRTYSCDPAVVWTHGLLSLCRSPALFRVNYKSGSRK